MDPKGLRNLSPSKLLRIKAHEEKVAKFQALESSVLNTLYDFLVAALTMICRDRKLTPNHKDIFSYSYKFGIHIPEFVSSQARLYIEGIAKKAVALIRQNALQACIFHVKEARLYCHQRFVFKVEGEWSLSECKTREPSSILLRLENHCHNSLLKLTSSQNDLSDLQFAPFSRWSISLGLREDFMLMLKENNILNPFQTDPDNHFPWKRTLRPAKSDKQLDNIPIGENRSHHQPTPTATATSSANIIAINEDRVDPKASKSVNDEQNSHPEQFSLDNCNKDNTPQEKGDCPKPENSNDDEVMMDLDEILENDNGSNICSFSNESSFWGEEDEGEEDEESVFLVPIYSFKVLDGLVLNIFALDYSEIVEKQIKILGKDQFLASTKGA